MAANPPADLNRVLAAMGSELITASELAARVGVCQRTIYRCISRLRRQGHQIMSGPGAGAGYLLRRSVGGGRAHV